MGPRLLRPLFLAALLIAAAPPVVTDPRFDAMIAEARATMLADPEKAVVEARQASGYADRAPAGPQRELMRATAAWLVGEALSRTRENESAGPLLEAAARQAHAIAPGSRLEADALLSRGSVRAAAGNVAGAMSDFHAAHDLFLKLGEPRSRARAFAQIANLYYDANDWTNALRYFGQALDVYHADAGLAVAIRNGRGVSLMELKRLREAAREFDEALALARQMKSPLLTATVLNNAARVRLASGDVAGADRMIAESMALTRGDAPAGFRTRQLALAAQSAYQRGDYVKAGRLSDEVFAGRDLSRTTLADREAHETAYETYRRLGRNDLALAHLQAQKRLDDEATELARSNGAALMAARFDFANQELRIANLKADDLQKSIAYERASARTQRFVLLGGVGATLLIIALLAVGLVTLRRSRDKVRAANADLTRVNDRLGKALAAKTEFLATTSHEIRTPLNGILGMTQVILADKAVDPATRDRVGVVHGAGVTMRALVDDILDVAKMETGNLTVETVAFDLSATLHEATRMWAAQASAKGLDFGIDFSSGPGWILGDPARLRQIVFNLLSNAVKFTHQGSIRVGAAAEGDTYRVTVEDTGIGIAPAQHEEIFESFKQADAGTTRQYGGTGLGLTICRRLSRALGGDVTVASEEGAGATFTLTLPLVSVPAEVDAGDARAETDGAVLVIDRNPITRAMFKSLLERHAPSIAVAGGEDALGMAGGRRFAQLLVDDATAKAAGDAAAFVARLRAAQPDARILVLWPAGEAVTGDALVDAGADQLLLRPIAKDSLVDALFGSAAASSKIVTQAA